MSDKISKLSVLNIVLLSVIIALACVAIIVIVQVYGRNAPAPRTAVIEPPADSTAAAVKHLAENPPASLQSARDALAEHLVTDFKDRVLWQRRVGKLEGWSVAIDDDSVYVTTSAGMLYAINRDSGEVRWSRTLDEYLVFGPVLDEAGNVYCCAWSKAWSHDREGNLNWEFSIPGKVLAKPVVDSKGNLVIKAEDRETDAGLILAVNPQGGERWRYAAEYELTSTHLAAMINGRVGDLGKGGVFQTLTPAGTRGWGLALSDRAMGPAVDRQGLVYVAANPYDDRPETCLLVCMEPRMGDEVWSAELPNYAKRGPYVNDAQRVYVLCLPPKGNHLYSLPVVAFEKSKANDKTGTKLWETDLLNAQTLVCSPHDGDPLGVNTSEGSYFLDSSGKILFSLGDREGHPHPIAIRGNTAYCYADEVLTAVNLSPPD